MWRYIPFKVPINRPGLNRVTTANQDISNYKISEFKINTESYSSILKELIAAKGKPTTYNYFFKSCSSNLRDILTRSGVNNLIGFSPQLLKFSIEHPHLMNIPNAGVVNSAIQSTEKKK